MRSWELTLSIDRTSHLPLPQQLVLAIDRGHPLAGASSRGAALPGTRPLARTLGLHRNTVVAAFDELRAQGWLETTRASHTRVTRTLPVAEVPAPRRGAAKTLGFPLRPFENSSRSFEAAPREVLDFTGGPARRAALSFAPAGPGVPARAQAELG